MAVELATAYISLVPSMRGVQAALASELAPVASASTAAGAKSGTGFASGFKSAIGKKVIGVAAIAAIGKGVYELGETYHDAFKKIRIATGDTGKALDGLEEDFKAVASATPASLDDVATAVGGIAARLHLTGKPLQDLSLNIIRLTRLTGGDIKTNVAALTRLMGDWSVKSRDQTDALNEVYRASQATGAGVDQLALLMVQFGSPLRQLGFGFEEALAMFGKFEAEGVNLTTMLPGLRMALKNLAIPSEDLASLMERLGVTAKQPKQALEQVFEAISSDKVKEADQTLLASSVFGGRAWADMKAAVDEGRFSFGDLIKEIKGGGDTIAKSSDDVATFSGAWDRFKNILTVNLGPAAADFNKKLGEWMTTLNDEGIPALKDWLNEQRPLGEDLVELGRNTLPVVVSGIKGLADIVSTLANALSALPSPLKSVALAMGAVALAGRGMITRVGAVGTAMSNMVLDFRTAPSKMDAVKSRFSTMASGAKSLAGAAGLGALIVGLGETNDAVSTLELAGAGGLIGFQAGGPIGAAIGAGVGALGGLVKAILSTGDAAKDSMPPLTDYTDALNNLTGAADRSTRAMVAKTLEDKGLLLAAKKAGISTSDMVTAIIKGGPALKGFGDDLERVKGQVFRLEHPTDAMRESMTHWTDAQVEAYEQSIKNKKALIDLLESILHERDGMQDSIATVRRQAEAIRGQSVDIQGLKKLYDRMPKKIDTVLRAVDADTTRQQLIQNLKAAGAIPKEIRTALKVFGFPSAKEALHDWITETDRNPDEIVTRLRNEGVDLTKKQLQDIFDEQGKLPRDVVIALKQVGGSQLVADVRAAASGVNKAIGDSGIPDEGVSISLNAQASKTAAQIAEFASAFHAATGGPVPVWGTPGKDSVPAMLMPDEHVFTTSDVAKAGHGSFRRGHRVMLAIRRMIQRGQLGKLGDVPAMAAGGPVWTEGVGLNLGSRRSVAGIASAANAIQAANHVVNLWFSRGLSNLINRILTTMPSGTGSPLGFGGILTPAGLARGQAFANSQVGKPYGWGMVGPYSYDCSGFQSAVVNAAFGRYPYSRLGSTATMPWSPYGGVGRYTIGWTTNAGGGIGHTSGNIWGLNVESNGSEGVVTGSRALSPLSSMFSGLFHYDRGGILKPGFTLAYNGTGRDELVIPAYARGGQVTASGSHTDPTLSTIAAHVIKVFKVSGKQTKAETRSVIHELLQALKEVLGKDSPFLERMRRTTDHLLDVQKRQDDVVKRYQKANDKLDSLMDKQKELMASIRQAFTHEAFGEDISSVRQSRVQLQADRNDARKALRQLRTAERRGLDKNILKQIAQSGNTALIRDLAKMTPKQIKGFERDFKSRQQATQALAKFVGRDAMGKQIASQRHLVHRLNHSVNHWDRIIEKQERKIERATRRGTFEGVRAGMREREHHQRRIRRARAIR